jgi:hypothetical protein
MQDHIRVRVAAKPMSVRYFNAAKHQLAAENKPMDIMTYADPKTHDTPPLTPPARGGE